MHSKKITKKINKKKHPLDILKNKYFRLILEIGLIVIFVFLLLFPRSVELINKNPIFGFDQGREYLAARNIAVNHNLILIGTELGAGSAGINGIFHGPMYYYLLTIPYIIFGGNPVGGVFLLFLLNVFAVFFLFYFVKKVFGVWYGVLAAFIIAMSPFFIAQARFLWSPNPTAFFILISFYFTYQFKNSKKISVFLAAFFAAFVYNFEMGIAIPLCLSLLIYSIHIFKSKYKNYLFLMLGFAVGFLPMLIFEVRHNLLGIRGLVSYLFTSKTTSNAVSNQHFIIDHFNAIISSLNNTFGLQSILPQFLFYIPFVILICLTVIFLIKENNRNLKNTIIYFFLLIIITFLVFLNLKNALYPYYLTDLCIVYIFFFIYVVYASFNNKNYKTFYVLIACVVGLVFYSIQMQYKTTVYDLSDYGGTAKLKGKVDAVDYIYRDAAGKPFSLLVFSPPVYTYPYDYIVEWYGSKKYGYVPSKEKKGTFYLLIEKDPEKPWSYKGWLETVIKVGKVDYTKTLKSGFIVQKRTLDI